MVGHGNSKNGVMIHVKIGDIHIKLGVEQARELYEQLSGIFGASPAIAPAEKESSAQPDSGAPDNPKEEAPRTPYIPFVPIPQPVEPGYPVPWQKWPVVTWKWGVPTVTGNYNVDASHWLNGKYIANDDNCDNYLYPIEEN